MICPLYKIAEETRLGACLLPELGHPQWLSSEGSPEV